ncbi:MAG TPA: ribosomal subunit interface protein, partial [Psychrobacter sp.]|nr:ribosomal subunit interface protein [Psychrobacter sp.]
KLDRQVRKYKTRLDRKTRASKRKERLALPVAEPIEESYAY